MNIILHKGKSYITSDETPKNGDLVLTDNYGVWEFRDDTGKGSAPMPFWANKNTCKKLIEYVTDKMIEDIFNECKKRFGSTLEKLKD